MSVAADIPILFIKSTIVAVSRRNKQQLCLREQLFKRKLAKIKGKEHFNGGDSG